MEELVIVSWMGALGTEPQAQVGSLTQVVDFMRGGRC